jgi:hypothetical protein
VTIFGTAQVLLTRLTITNGTGANNGGGVFMDSGTALTLDHSTVTNNTALAGGGIYEGLNAGPVTLIRSTVTNNTADNCAPPGSVPGCTG